MQRNRQSPKSHNSWAERAVSLGGEVHDEADGATYRAVRFLGRGGMGEVYEVVRVNTGDHYALKCLQLEHVRNAKTIERTRREALTLRDLRHPTVVRIHATGVREDGLIWMVMDLLTAHTWAQVHQRIARLPLPGRFGSDARSRMGSRRSTPTRSTATPSRRTFTSATTPSCACSISGPGSSTAPDS